VQTLPEKATPAPPAPAPVKVAEEKPKPVPPAPKPKVPPKTEEAPKVDLSKKKVDTAKSEKSALDKIKAMQAIDKFKGEVTAYARPKVVRGNVVTTGDSLTGDNKVDFDQYFSKVEERIRQNWSLPQWLADAHLRAQALVLIDESGTVKKKQIVKSSGNSEFDSRMMDAIDKASPFPAPPDKLRDILGAKGVVFNFPQRGDS
jgi:TonB family protein